MKSQDVFFWLSAAGPALILIYGALCLIVKIKMPKEKLEILFKEKSFYFKIAVNLILLLSAAMLFLSILFKSVCPQVLPNFFVANSIFSTITLLIIYRHLPIIINKTGPGWLLCNNKEIIINPKQKIRFAIGFFFPVGGWSIEITSANNERTLCFIVVVSHFNNLSLTAFIDRCNAFLNELIHESQLLLDNYSSAQKMNYFLKHYKAPYSNFKINITGVKLITHIEEAFDDDNRSDGNNGGPDDFDLDNLPPINTSALKT